MFLCVLKNIFFWLLRPSKSSGALKKDSTFGFLTFGYALKDYTLDQPFYKLYIKQWLVQKYSLTFLKGSAKTTKGGHEVIVLYTIYKSFVPIVSKTFTENWNLKAPFVGTLLAYGLNHISFGNKTFFFLVESWNFKYLLKKEFRETSQNINSFSSFHSFYLLFDWVEILWGFTKFIFPTDAENFSSFLKNKKVLFLIKHFLSHSP